LYGEPAKVQAKKHAARSFDRRPQQPRLWANLRLSHGILVSVKTLFAIVGSLTGLGLIGFGISQLPTPGARAFSATAPALRALDSMVVAESSASPTPDATKQNSGAGIAALRADEKKSAPSKAPLQPEKPPDAENPLRAEPAARSTLTILVSGSAAIFVDEAAVGAGPKVSIETALGKHTVRVDCRSSDGGASSKGESLPVQLKLNEETKVEVTCP
jgi:hypothetical protein